MAMLKQRPYRGRSENNPLPSRFTYGDIVHVYFGTAGMIRNCEVIKVHFTPSKVSYDVEVRWHTENLDNTEYEHVDRLYNLDSAVVFHPDDFESEGSPLENIVTGIYPNLKS